MGDIWWIPNLLASSPTDDLTSERILEETALVFVQGPPKYTAQMRSKTTVENVCTNVVLYYRIYRAIRKQMILGNVLQAVNWFSSNHSDKRGVKIMENESMETSKPSITKKLRRPILALLMISAIVGGAAGVTLFVTQNFTYKAPTTATVQTTGALDFGLLSSIASSSKTFTNGLIIGSGTTINITFAFVSPTLTWNTVFSGIAIVVQTQGNTPVGLVCISLGSGTCPAGLTTKFIPTSSTSYDYVATYTTALVIPSAVSLQVIWAVTPVSIAQTTIPLGTAANFAVLAGSTITNTGLTVISGDLGLSPGTAVTGFPPGIVNGALRTGDATAAIAKTDLSTAINTANALTLPILLAGDLGGRTLVPGLYKSTSSLAVTGALTLDAQGDPNAVWVFQIASTLTTLTGSQIILTGGAQASNIFWVVGSSATLGTTSVFKGTIMAYASITITTGATVDGRALAEVGAVTLDSNIITKPL